MPLPESSITCAFDDALSVIETSPDFDPAVCGEKVTLIEQLAPGATCTGQVVELRLN